MSMTVGKLAAKYGLSRSTLLYYDAIGLLSPAKHIKGEYRFYNSEDQNRLERICVFRRAGVPLKEIKTILDSPETDLTSVLNQRFEELGREILQLQEQQRIIAGLLKNTKLMPQSGAMTRELWVSLLRSSGFSEEDMRQWHITFERRDPQKHLAFLKHLQIPGKEVARIRSWAQSGSSEEMV